MNIAVTGSAGNLGSVLIESTEKKDSIFFAIPSEIYRPKFDCPKIIKFFKDYNISTIIHCASLTDVDFAELNQDFAYNSNVSLTRQFVQLSKNLDLKFVFISSTGVYGSNVFVEGLPNTESLEPNPLNIYHSTKLQAEEIVCSMLPNSLILRVGWLFGSISPDGKDFVKSRIEEMLKLSPKDTYFANEEQFGNPTSSQFVKLCITLLLKNNANGIFNCVNTGEASRFQFIKKIKEICDLDFILVPRSSNSFTRVARVPNNETGCNIKLQNYVKTSNWEQYLEEYCLYLLNKVRI